MIDVIIARSDSIILRRYVAGEVDTYVRWIPQGE
jgi:hypothetical protein